MRMRTPLVILVVAAALCVPAQGVFGQPASTTASTFDETIPPGANFDKAEFRLWLPPGTTTVRAVAVLVPGSNGDGRPMAEEAAWQTFAATHQLALIACRFTDKPARSGLHRALRQRLPGESGRRCIDASDEPCEPAPNIPSL